MSLSAYGKYKNSGVEWLAEVPTHWDVAPIKQGFFIVGGSTPKSDNDAYWEGGIPWVTPSDLSQLSDFYISESQRTITEDGLASCGTTMVPSGSIVLSTRAPIGSLAIAATSVCTNQGCKSLVPKGALISLFTAYLLSVCTEQLNLRGKGTTFLELSGDELSAFRVPFPPLPEQTAIAAFLNSETGKIDALVEEQTRLIELLKEKRQAVISHAVTKGLDTNAPMKDSGVEWLGEVPAHWDVKRLKRVTPQITVGIVVEPSKYYVDEGIPALRSLNVRPGSITSDNLVFISRDANELLSKSKLNAGDLVAVRTGQPGTTAVVPPEFDGCNCIDLIIIRKPQDGCENFLCWYLASEPAVRQFDVGSGGAIQQHFNIGTAVDLIVTWPSETEQRVIAGWLERQTVEIDALVSQADSAITLLQERRSALISAAVTGMSIGAESGPRFASKRDPFGL